MANIDNQIKTLDKIFSKTGIACRTEHGDNGWIDTTTLKEMLREVLLAGKEPLDNDILEIVEKVVSVTKDKIESLERRVSELENQIPELWEKFIVFKNKKDAPAVEECVDCKFGTCNWHNVNPEPKVEAGPIGYYSEYGVSIGNPKQKKECSANKSEVKSITPSDPSKECNCPDDSEPHTHNIPPSKKYCIKCLNDQKDCKCKPSKDGNGKTLDTRKEMAFIERVWMEGDNRPYSDMKKAIEALVDKVRTLTPSVPQWKILVDRKVAEDNAYRNIMTPELQQELRKALGEK